MELETKIRGLPNAYIVTVAIVVYKGLIPVVGRILTIAAIPAFAPPRMVIRLFFTCCWKTKILISLGNQDFIVFYSFQSGATTYRYLTISG